MIAIINGPNLNMLGVRKPEIYGSTSMEELMPKARKLVHDLSEGNETLEYFQSNTEGVIIDRIQKLGYDPNCKGIIINPGAYAHYSVAIRDAIEMIPAPVIEVHLSNIYAREEFRHSDVVAPVCRGVICGLCLDGYLMAIRSLLEPLR